MIKCSCGSTEFYMTTTTEFSVNTATEEITEGDGGCLIQCVKCNGYIGDEREKELIKFLNDHQ